MVWVFAPTCTNKQQQRHWRSQDFQLGAESAFSSSPCVLHAWPVAYVRLSTPIHRIREIKQMAFSCIQWSN